jgi:hypothetical protein
MAWSAGRMRFVYRFVAADQDGDVAGLGSMHAAGDGAGEGGHAVFMGTRGQCLDFGEVVGAHLDPGVARRMAGSASAMTALAALGEGRQVMRHRSCREFLHRGNPMRSRLDGDIRRGALQIVHAHIEAAAGEVGREMFAEIAQTDEAVTHSDPYVQCRASSDQRVMCNE